MEEKKDTDANEPFNSELEKYFKGQKARAMICLRVKPEEVDNISFSLGEEENISDIYLVTGEMDIMLKLETDSLDALKEFIDTKIEKMKGVLKTHIMFILTSYKANEQIILKTNSSE